MKYSLTEQQIFRLFFGSFLFSFELAVALGPIAIVLAATLVPLTCPAAAFGPEIVLTYPNPN